MATLAFCGLGQMGAPMAARLVAAGHDVSVWNRTEAKTRALEARGARRALTPAEGARGADAVFTMLGTPDAVRSVVLGDSGVAEALEPPATLIEMSTIGPAAVREVASELGRGADVLDAPVLGSVPQATDGDLTLFVGGRRASFERRRDLLELLGRPTYLGALGSGAAMKIVVNSALVALMTCLGEALAIADGLGLDEAATLDALAGSPLAPTVARKRDNVESGSFPPNFKLGLAAKDAGLVVAAARDAGVDLRLAPAAKQWFDQAAAAGLGELDYSAVIAEVRGRAGTIDG